VASGQCSVASRAELLRLVVLRNIADSYVNLVNSIASPVVRDGAKCGMVIERAEIVRALTELVELGWAKAYLGNTVSRQFEPMERAPTRAEMEDLDGAWFYITPEGLNGLRANWDAQPLDDEGERKKNWKPPES
jgi:hypothetical protein